MIPLSAKSRLTHEISQSILLANQETLWTKLDTIHTRDMRQVSPAELQTCVWDFLEGVVVLPRWIDSSASDKPGRGHYEWGNWSEAIRSTPMWVMGGPWRAMIADIRAAKLIPAISSFHKLKDQVVWEIVEQTYLRAERDRKSSAEEDTVKTRIRSVFSWQRRHDIKKNSLIWFLDFAFVLAAYSEFQARMLFSSSSVPNDDPARSITSLIPAEFGAQAIKMEYRMIEHGFLPFYCNVDGLSDAELLTSRRLTNRFCQRLDPPAVDMDIDVRETRGMPREEKAVDFMTPWLQRMSMPEHAFRWKELVLYIAEHRDTLNHLENFKGEICRSIVFSLLLKLTRSGHPETGYVYDIAASTAVEQSLKELKVSLRLSGQKRKRVVPRRTLRHDLDGHIEKRYASQQRTGRAASSQSGG